MAERKGIRMSPHADECFSKGKKENGKKYTFSLKLEDLLKVSSESKDKGLNPEIDLYLFPMVP